MDELDTDEILEYHVRRESHELLIDDHREDYAYTFALSLHGIPESFFEFFLFGSRERIVPLVEILRYSRVYLPTIYVIPILDHNGG
jgi:hypothetical protein